MAYSFAESIQRGILYLLKSDKDFYNQIVNLVQPDYFEYPAHSNIFLAVKDYHEKYFKLPTDDFIVQEVKNRKKESESLSDYTDELYRINNLDTSSTDNPDYFLDLIEKFAKKEAMKKAILDCVVLVKEGKVEETEAVVRKALTVSRDVDTGQDYFTDVNSRWKRMLDTSEKNKFSVFLPSLNNALEGGLGSKELSMVVAPPGVGKSLFLVNQAVDSLMEGRKVLYVSLEMSEDKIAQRFDSIMTLLPQRSLPVEPGAVEERLEMFSNEFPNSRLIIKEFPTACATVNSVRSLLVQLKNYEDFEPDVLIVDYLELLRPTQEGMQEYLSQQRIAEELRGLAVQNKFLVWTATQTNRQGRLVKLITDAELGDSYGKIRTCDFAVSLNQTEEEFDEGTMRLYVMKSRNSRQRFVVPMVVDYEVLRMTEAAQ
jgi:replicative DNA helicase